MKHYSESFNKQSRLIVAPGLEDGPRGGLAQLDASTLKARLKDALKVQQDFYPCFDWAFPPPVFPKAPGPAGARELLEDAPIVPGKYSVYAHIPFCATLCSFCYYRVLPGRGGDEKSQYLDTQRNVRKTVWLGPPRDYLYYRKIEIFQKAAQLLASLGYRQLFQNTFARQEGASYRHQLRRWENLTLIALGVGSMGYAPRKPYQNYGTTSAYFERLDSGVLPIEAVETLSPEMEVARQVTTQLRLTRVNLRGIREKYGVDLEIVFRDLLRALEDLGHLDRRGDEISLRVHLAEAVTARRRLRALVEARMDWTGWADVFVAVMQALSMGMLIAGAVLWIRESLRGEDRKFVLVTGRRAPELEQASTETACG